MLDQCVTGSTDRAEDGESLKQPEARCRDPAGEERETGEHKQHAHRFFDRSEMAFEAGKEGREGLDRKGGNYEWNAEPRGIEREQAGTFEHRFLGRRHSEDCRQHRPDAGPR